MNPFDDEDEDLAVCADPPEPRAWTESMTQRGALTVIEGRPNPIYHAGTALNAGGIKELAKSPAHYQSYLAGDRQRDSPALLKGRAFHALLESEAAFAADFVEEPAVKIKRTDKAGKAEWAAFCAAAGGRTVLSHADWRDVHGMVAAITAQPDLTELLTAPGVLREASLYWDEGGIRCRCRPDWWNPTTGLAIDYKSTSDASEVGFARAVRNLGYDLAAAHYLAGTHARTWGWLAVESSPPYALALYLCPATQAELVTAGQRRTRLLATLRECQLTDDWPGYEGHASPIRPLTWAWRNGAS